jgi:hypothetical protein
MAVTTPLEETVAKAAADEDQVDELVTFCIDPSLIVAVAVNCEVEPMAGGAPETATDMTVLDDVEVEPHAATMAARNRARTNTLSERIFMTSLPPIRASGIGCVEVHTSSHVNKESSSVSHDKIKAGRTSSNQSRLDT